MARGGGSRGGGFRGGSGFSSASSRGSRGFSSSTHSAGRGSFSSSRGSMGSGRPSSSVPRPGGYRPGSSGPIISPVIINTSRPRTRTVVRTVNSGSTSNAGGGCSVKALSVVLIIIALVFLFAWLSGSSDNQQSGNNSEITSVVEREPLPSGSVNETGYFTDHLGWIEKSSTLTAGMKKFYRQTGVQPYLYLADWDEMEAAGGMEALAEGLYDELFTDEAHFLFAYSEDGSDGWEMYFVTGTQATAVIDTEAEEIIYQHFVRYYEDTDLSDEEFFAKVFEEAAEVMMHHETNGYDVAKVALLVVGGVGIVGLIIYAVNKKRQLKLEEQKEKNEFTEKMMNVPLEKFSDAEADKELEELMKKYQEKS